MKPHLALVVLLPGVVACRGGSSPTAPALPETSSFQAAAPSAVLTFVSGETQGPVASAVVIVGDQRYETDSAGRIVLEPGPSPQAEVDVEAPTFFVRRTLVRSDRFTLWPRQSPTGLDEEYSARLVYNCGGNCDTGGEPLLRVLSSRVSVEPASELQGHPEIMATHRDAADLMTAATGGSVTFSVTSPGRGTGLTVSTRVDPSDPAINSLGAAAVTRRFLGSRGEVVDANIVFRSYSLARRVPLVLHELGHVFGLGHSPRSGDVMWNGPELYDATDFSPREKLAIDLMLQRLPGNRFPDSDGNVAGVASRARGSSVLACPAP
jgi:hypothetical protein